MYTIFRGVFCLNFHIRVQFQRRQNWIYVSEQRNRGFGRVWFDKYYNERKEFIELAATIR